MPSNASHLSDANLILFLDGELRSSDLESVQKHLAACWACRARLRTFNDAIADFLEAYRGNDAQLPPPTGSRALLQVRLTQAAAADSNGRRFRWPLSTRSRTYTALACLCGIAMVAAVIHYASPSRILPVTKMHPILSMPEHRLTPGATVAFSREEVCRANQGNNREVPVSLQRRVFEEYGIAEAKPQAYEVDYLITPALGGADDIRNLWPQSYLPAVWNAHVKDELESRLRELVCSGNLDLATAQRELADDWIAAYKKYVRADRASGAVR